MGLLLCFTIMFVSNWIFAIMAIALASIIYKYIGEYSVVRGPHFISFWTDNYHEMNHDYHEP